jgi:Na+/H+-translocating membrane pyrophosphatase
VALAALGMLSTLATGLTVDGFGPVSDNAGGIAEMSGMEEEVSGGAAPSRLDKTYATRFCFFGGFAVLLLEPLILFPFPR